MANWTWRLILVGVILIAIASFAFNSGTATGQVVQGNQGMSAGESFAVFLGVIGLGAMIWSISKV